MSQRKVKKHKKYNWNYPISYSIGKKINKNDIKIEGKDLISMRRLENYSPKIKRESR
jgi:hypothetical protein